MNPRDPFDGLLASLHDAALDDALWPATARLIDEACGIIGSSVIVGVPPSLAKVPTTTPEVSFAAFYRRGERRLDLEREYYDNYFHQDERVARLLQLGRGKLVRNATLFTPRQRRTSVTWNEMLPRAGTQNGLCVRLRERHGLRATWVFADPVTGNWETDRIQTIQRLLPHLSSFVHLRQTLAGVQALGASIHDLFDSTGVGVIHLDRRGRIVETNDHARDLFFRGNGLWDEGGFLRTWLPEDEGRLKRLVTAALPTLSGRGVGGSMLVRHPFLARGLTLHIQPVTVRQMDFGAPDLGALVLVTGMGGPQRRDANQVGRTLGLTPVESRVAVGLAEGRTVPDIAVQSGRAESTVRSQLKNIHRKLGVSHRADLVRLVLSVSERTGFLHRF